MRILIVHDEANVRIRIRRLAEEAGFEVDEVANGHRALQIIELRQPDLVLCDMSPTGRNGCEWIAEAQRTAPDVRVARLSVEWRHLTDCADLLEAIAEAAGLVLPRQGR